MRSLKKAVVSCSDLVEDRKHHRVALLLQRLSLLFGLSNRSWTRSCAVSSAGWKFPLLCSGRCKACAANSHETLETGWRELRPACRANRQRTAEYYNRAVRQPFAQCASFAPTYWRDTLSKHSQCRRSFCDKSKLLGDLFVPALEDASVF